MVDIVAKSAAFREATVEKTPTVDKDIVNKLYADGLLGANLAAMEADLIPKLDNTYDLGSQTKRWKNIYAVLAVLTFITIGGVYIQKDTNDRLEFNASAVFNGSIEARDNITADFFYGDGSQLINLPGAINYTNSSWNTNSIPGNVSCLRINGSSSNLCTLVDTDTIGTNFSYNIASIPGALNATLNQTMNTNLSYCFGGSSCPARITYNGSTLIIRVN